MNLNSYYTNYPNNVYFTAMKKNQFSGIDRACVDKFAPPIEKFNTNDDLQSWAKNKRDEIINTNYPAKSKEGTIQRKAILKEWGDYLVKDNEAYTPVMGLMIISTIIKNLKPNNDNMPFILNKGVLADTIESVKNSEQCNIEKTYQNKLQSYYFEGNNTHETKTGWILIPSKEHDPKNFNENVERLKMLSHKSWCTKSYNAKPYLEKGDFHVYLENGNPKIGMRFYGNEVKEVQGEKNNGDIPWRYLDELKNYTNKNKISLKPIKHNINRAKKTKSEIETLKAKFTSKNTLIDKLAIKAGFKKDYTNPEVIFKELGLEPQKKEDGTFSIFKFEEPSEYTYSEIGIDEQKLIDCVSEIRNYADFNSSNIKTLKTLRKVGEFLDITNSKITSLGTLESVGGELRAQNSNLKDLGNLKFVGTGANFANTHIKTLNKLKVVKGSLNIEDLELKDLGRLEYVGRELWLCNTSLEYKDNSLKFVGGDVWISNGQIDNSITKEDLKSVEIKGEIYKL